jgi:excisionase family DNA binding protein
VSDGPTADEVLRAHGFSGDRLLKLARKIANDKLARLGGFMHEQRLEDLVGFLALQGVQAALRYDPERAHARYGSRGGDPFASWLADILDHGVTDWYRSKAEGGGDRRYNNDNRLVLDGDMGYEEPGDAFEREFDLRRAEQGVDFEEAEADLGHGLGDEARLGLYYARLRAEGYRIPNATAGCNGDGPRLTATGRALEAARKELAGRVLQPRPRRKRQPIRRATVASIVQKPPLLAIPDVSARINFSEKTVRRLIARGELPAIRPGGERGRIRVDQDELERWLAARSAQSRSSVSAWTPNALR